MLDQTELRDDRELFMTIYVGMLLWFSMLISFPSPSMKTRRQLINFAFWRYKSVVFDEIERNSRQAGRQSHFPCFSLELAEQFNLSIYFYIHKLRKRHASLGNAGWRNTAVSRRESNRLLPKWSDNSSRLSALWMFNGKNQESLVNSYSCVLLMLV